MKQQPAAPSLQLLQTPQALIRLLRAARLELAENVIDMLVEDRAQFQRLIPDSNVLIEVAQQLSKRGLAEDSREKLINVLLNSPNEFKRLIPCKDDFERVLQAFPQQAEKLREKADKSWCEKAVDIGQHNAVLNDNKPSSSLGDIVDSKRLPPGSSDSAVDSKPLPLSSSQQNFLAHKKEETTKAEPGIFRRKLNYTNHK